MKRFLSFVLAVSLLAAPTCAAEAVVTVDDTAMLDLQSILDSNRDSTRLSERELSLLEDALAQLESGEPEASPDITFTDVSEKDWFYTYVMTCARYGLVSGVGNGRFAPNQRMSRVEFLTVIIRYLYPKTEKNYQGDRSTWWTPYYNIALEKGLIKTTEFTADDMETAMTRQEMALVVSRALAETKWMPLTIVDDSKISDYATIDPYYRDAVKIAYSAGIITGRDSTGTFSPKETLTRGQACTILCRLPQIQTETSQTTAKNPVVQDDVVTVSGSWYVDEIQERDHRFDEGALHQEWVEGEPHGEPHVGDVVIKADGTRVTLEATQIRNCMILGWGKDGPQGVDPYTGTAFINGTIKQNSLAWWDYSPLLKDPVTGSVFSKKEWIQINSGMKPTYDGKKIGELGGYGNWFEWDGWAWLWNGPI